LIEKYLSSVWKGRKDKDHKILSNVVLRTHTKDSKYPGLIKKLETRNRSVLHAYKLM